MATFVLVHGAWHGGWCYQRLARLLRDNGHEVYCPTLSGLGERHHLFTGDINLSLHIADIVNLMEFEELQDVILVGHSYGGMVITGVADALAGQINTLVYLDAFVPDDGHAAWDYLPDLHKDSFMTGASHMGGYAIPPIPAEVFNVNESDRAMVDDKCTPQPWATFRENIALNGDFEKIARHVYIYASGWQGSPFTTFHEEFLDDAEWESHAIDCGHDVMLDAPDELARILLDLT